MYPTRYVTVKVHTANRQMACGATPVVLRLGAIAEADRAVAETAFVEQLEVHARVRLGEGPLATTHYDGHEEPSVLVRPSSDAIAE